MPYVPYIRAALPGVLALGLAACCSQPPQGYRPPPPGPFGPGGPPPHDWGRAGPHGPGSDPGFHEAIATCAEELDLPMPSAEGARARPGLTPEQHDLLEVCLEDQGYPPPMPAPGDREDPV